LKEDKANISNCV